MQTFGARAADEERTEVVSAMRSYLRHLAVADYRAICAGLSRGTVEQAEELSGNADSCPSVIAGVMAPRKAVEAEVLDAARGDVYQVRTEGETAFVLFTPVGGKPSFFVMKREDGRWKATGLAPGTLLQGGG